MTGPTTTSWTRSTAFVLLFAAAVVLGRESRPDGSEVALVWPAAGVGAWWLMGLRGRRLAVDAALLALVTVLLQLGSGLAPAAALGFGAVNLAHGLTARYLALRLWPRSPALAAPVDVLRLLGTATAAGLVSGTASALLAWALLGGDAWESAQLFVTRNTGTTFVVLAVVLAVRTPHRLRHLLDRHRATEFLVLLVLTAVAAVVVLAWQGALPVSFLLLCVPMWAGARLGVPRAALLTGLVAAVAVESTAAGSNALSDLSSITQLTATVQALTVLAMLIALLLATLHGCHDPGRDTGSGTGTGTGTGTTDGTHGGRDLAGLDRPGRVLSPARTG